MSNGKGIKTFTKPKFTTYKLAGDPSRSIQLREEYMEERMQIFRNQQDKLFSRAALDEEQSMTTNRGGYPKRRYRDASLPSKRGKSKFLNQFKFMDMAGDRVKVFVLHATRGWKAFA